MTIGIVAMWPLKSALKMPTAIFPVDVQRPDANPVNARNADMSSEEEIVDQDDFHLTSETLRRSN